MSERKEAFAIRRTEYDSRLGVVLSELLFKGAHVDPHTPKRDASAPDPVAESAANVALGRPALGVIGDLQLSPAAGTPKKTREQGLAPANRAAPMLLLRLALSAIRR